MSISSRQLNRWFPVILGISLAGLTVIGLIDGVVAVPSSFGISGAISRADQPGTYWTLVVLYAAGAAIFLVPRLREHLPAVVDDQAPVRPRPVLRGLAWIGLAFAVALIGAAVFLHFTMDPLMRLPFVLVAGGGGLFIGLACAGYLITGRWQ